MSSTEKTVYMSLPDLIGQSSTEYLYPIALDYPVKPEDDKTKTYLKILFIRSLYPVVIPRRRVYDS
jgi:hypothetical protein